jgi:hypothetical protein
MLVTSAPALIVSVPYIVPPLYKKVKCFGYNKGMEKRIKIATSFRLSPLAIKILEVLKEHKGVPYTSLVEESLRLLARREGIDMSTLKPDTP